MSYLPYPVCHDSGIEWLGDVPEHWRVSSLGFLSKKIGSGKTPRGGSEVYSSAGILFIRSQNVYDTGLTLKDVVYISDEIDREMANTRVETDDILLNITGASIGRTCIVPEGLGSANVNQHVCIIRLNSGSQRFVAWTMKSRGVKSQVELAQSGAAREGLNFEHISKFRLCIPSTDEQSAIANFLDRETAKIDTLIDKQEQLIKLLEEKRQAVISHAVTKGLNPDVPMKDCGVEWLGEVPEHWDVLRVGQLFSESKESGQDELPVLSVSIHHGVSEKELSSEERDRKVSQIEDKSKYKRVRPYDLTYNMMRAWQGGFGAVVVDGLVSPAYVVARPKTETDTRYFELLLRTPNAITEMHRYSKGITDFRLRLYWDEFKCIQLAVPPAQEVSEILDYIAEYQKMFTELVGSSKKFIGLLKERRTALISAAVTGKIDVREAV